MTIASVMGVTTYSTVMNVADTDIANVMGVAQGGGGGATLLEGFEDTPNTGLYTNWTPFDVGGGPPTVTRTTSNVTQGTYSWRVQAGVSNFFGYIIADPFDITPYIPSPTSFLLDVYVQTIDASDVIIFSASDDGGATGESIESSPGATGAFTLTLPIGALDDFTNIQFSIGAISPGPAPLNGTVDFYVDNLRAS